VSSATTPYEKVSGSFSFQEKLSYLFDIKRLTNERR
jgi:hypothetical protein